MPQNPGLVDFASGPDGGVPCDLGLSIYRCLRRNLAFFRYWGCSFEASYPVCSPADTGCMAAEGSPAPSGAAGATSEVGDGGLPRLIVHKPPLARSRVADSCCVVCITSLLQMPTLAEVLGFAGPACIALGGPLRGATLPSLPFATLSFVLVLTCSLCLS